MNWAENVTNGEVIEHIGEEWALLNSILWRKAKWIGQILRRNYLLHDIIKGLKLKGLLDEFRTRRRHWEPKEEAEDRKLWERQFIT